MSFRHLLAVTATTSALPAAAVSNSPSKLAAPAAVMNDYQSYLARSSNNSHTAEFSLNVGPIVVPSSSVPYKIEYVKKSAKRVGNYLMGEVLGQGNFGKVREAVDTRTNERVAIKVLDVRRLRKLRSGESNVHREIAIMRRLAHENVAQFIEVFEMDMKHKMYIVLELIGGGSLRTLMESMPSGRLSEAQCKWYFRQLIEGLSYLHSQGIIHRDIKPSNLMITTKGVLKIADFGVAELLEDVAVDNVVCTETNGTPSFLSPEVASGAQSVSGRKSDIWAMGVTLYAIATGEMPFRGRTLYELLQHISKGEFQVPGFLSDDISELIAGMLEPDVSNRWTLERLRSHPWLNNDAGSGQAASEAVVTQASVQEADLSSSDLDKLPRSTEHAPIPGATGRASPRLCRIL